MTKKCSNCGYEGDSKFCPECGGEMIEIVEETIEVDPVVTDEDTTIDTSEETVIDTETDEKKLDSFGDYEKYKSDIREYSHNDDGINQSEQKKKRIIKILLLITALIAVIIIGFNIYSHHYAKDKVLEDHTLYAYRPYIEAYGFTIDNRDMKLLVKDWDDGFIAFDDLDSINYSVALKSFKTEYSDIKDEAEIVRQNDIDDGATNVSDIYGHSDYIRNIIYKYYTCKKDAYYKKVYVIKSDVEGYMIYGEVSSYGDNIDPVAKMIEEMKNENADAEDVKEKEENDKQKEEPKSEEAETKESDTTTEKPASKKREIENMDDDEIFMVMALAEKEIKNNLTYDAKKAKFSHLVDNWYMSEQDGYYTVMTTFEAPNEYGTMQKAGAVVAFTVTTKSKDGWSYNNADVHIEWQ